MRKYSSLFLFYTLLGMVVTGIVLYIEPHGRIAYWGGWRFLGLDKDQWEALHTILGFIMLIAGIIHLIVNWKVIKKYFKSRKDKLLSKEFIVTTLVVLIFTAGTIAQIPPFTYVMELGETIKESWEEPTIPPPTPHAELLSIKKLADIVGLTPTEVINILADNGIRVRSPSEKLKTISKRSGIPPYRIYEIIINAKEEADGKTTETGN